MSKWLIPEHVAEFLGLARSIAVGSCGASGRPCGVRGAAVRVADERTHVTLFLAQSVAGPTLENLKHNPRVAMHISHPVGHRAVQLKGSVRATRAADAQDHSFVRQCVAELATVVDPIGMPFERVMSMSFWPAAAIDVQVEEIYLQTPGPGAGELLGERRP